MASNRLFNFAHPRYWSTWLGFGLLWLVARIPWRWQMLVGRLIGLSLYHLLPSRRKVADINLAIAYPHLNNQERNALNRRHFISMGKGLFDSAFAWWANEAQVKAKSEVTGLQHLHDALATGRGVIMLGIHLSSVEMNGCLISRHIDGSLVFRPHQNHLINHFITSLRRHFGTPIEKNNIREMIRRLRKGEAVWYAPDQSTLDKNSVLSPFFGVEAMTNSGTARMVKMTNAIIITCNVFRSYEADGETLKGYRLHISEPLNDFPVDDVEASTLYLNHVFEDLIGQAPEQYFWAHKRYKRKDYDFYQRYLDQHPELNC